MQKSQANLEFLLKDQDKETFKKVKVYVQLLLVDKNGQYQQMIIGAIQNGLRQQTNHVFFLYSLRLAKEAIETFSHSFIEQFQQQLIGDYERIALWKLDVPDRKTLLFSTNPSKEQQNYSLSSFVLLLEEIKVWTMWFPQFKGQNSQFHILYEKLLDQGLQFPGFQYFKQDLVFMNINYKFGNEEQRNPHQQLIDDMHQQEERDHLMKRVQDLTYLNEKQREIIDQQNQIIQSLTHKLENKNKEKLNKVQEEYADKLNHIKQNYENQIQQLLNEINQLKKN